MDKVDGSRLILMAEAADGMSAIAYATELELTIEASTIPIAPDTDGGWDKHKKQNYQWRVTMNHLLSMVGGAVKIEQLIEADEEVNVMLAIVAPGGFDPAAAEAEEALLHGKALFRRMTITGQQGALAVMSVELLGNDELLA